MADDSHSLSSASNRTWHIQYNCEQFAQKLNVGVLQNQVKNFIWNYPEFDDHGAAWNVNVLPTCIAHMSLKSPAVMCITYWLPFKAHCNGPRMLMGTNLIRPQLETNYSCLVNFGYVPLRRYALRLLKAVKTPLAICRQEKTLFS